MITPSPLSCTTVLPLKKPPALPVNLKPLYYSHKSLNKVKREICRAGFSNDALFVIVIGTCMLSSLVLATPANKEEDTDMALDSTDARFAVMGIISFFPFFNWSNLSLSPAENWLPIASIIFCIVHIQLEPSIRNGDLQGFQLFSQASEYISSVNGNKDNHWERHQESSEQERKREDMNLSSAEEQSRNELQQCGVPGEPSDPEHMNV